MVDDNFGFRDDDERKAFYIALPVLALFGGLLYYFVFASDDNAAPDAIATGSAAFEDSDADGIADHIDQCMNEKGTLENRGCLQTTDSDNKPTVAKAANKRSDQTQVKSPQKSDQTTLASTTESQDAIDAERTVQSSDTVTETSSDSATVSNNIVRDVATPEPQPETVNEQTTKATQETVAQDKVASIDTDSDGVIDDDDACPDLPGNDQGCPSDTDADGIPDDADECPDIAGANNGCPSDKDADGVSDDDDACPEQAGTDKGCPSDKDADGVPDDTDACPDTAGVDDGCPADKDGDGVPDDADACPETVGTDKGCPADADADGVPDVSDACPDEAGTDKGCPAKKVLASAAKDTDVDGIADKDDKCPDIAGSPQNAGCPASTAIALTSEKPVTETEEKLIQDAGFNIQFNAGNSVLTGRSREILLEVAKVMQRYPDIKLEAHGFTDAEGGAEANKNLSQKRAQACIDVISDAGIDRDRLKALGFGEAQPIASNDTAVGRQKNRRVEFKLIR